MKRRNLRAVTHAILVKSVCKKADTAMLPLVFRLLEMMRPPSCAASAKHDTEQKACQSEVRKPCEAFELSASLCQVQQIRKALCIRI